jgi:protoporphyrinogen oxidase
MNRQTHWGIVGGGLLGMTLAWDLANAGNTVSLFEAGADPGGLASAWQIGDVIWDRHYHVTLASDMTLRALLGELGLERHMQWRTARTGFYFRERLHPFSSALDFARFPLLNPIEKLRFGAAIRQAAKLESPAEIEHLTVEEWLTRISGQSVFDKMWRPLLLAKLGADYRSTGATFMWATIRRMFAARRSGLKKEQFGYLPGGYARMLETFWGALGAAGVRLAVNAPAAEVAAIPDGVEIRFAGSHSMTTERFDRVVVTTPSALAAGLCPQLTPAETQSLKDVEYLGIVCVSLLLRRPLSNYYITNIADSSIPLTGVIEMSALVDREMFQGRSLVYLPRYLRPDDPLFQQSDVEIESQFLAALRRIHPSLDDKDILACRVSRARHVFPRPVAGRSKHLPPIDTSIPGVHVLNSAHIQYGTLNVNETVQLARQQARRLHEIARSDRAGISDAPRVHALARP